MAAKAANDVRASLDMIPYARDSRWGDVKYDNGSSEEEISHIRINLQYPQRVPMSRAMEDHQDKFVATIFDTACETPILLNITTTMVSVDRDYTRVMLFDPNSHSRQKITSQLTSPPQHPGLINPYLQSIDNDKTNFLYCIDCCGLF